MAGAGSIQVSLCLLAHRSVELPGTPCGEAEQGLEVAVQLTPRHHLGNARVRSTGLLWWLGAPAARRHSCADSGEGRKQALPCILQWLLDSRVGVPQWPFRSWLVVNSSHSQQPRAVLAGDMAAERCTTVVARAGPPSYNTSSWSMAGLWWRSRERSDDVA
ncbi:hypothetical protein ABPG77_009590 [Micractinium sp. CCAP 211/92]